MKNLWFIVAIAIALILGWDNGFALFFRAGFLLAAGLVLSRLWVWSHMRKLEGNIEGLAHRVQVGQELVVSVALRNPSLVPKPWLELGLKSDLPGVPASMVVALPGRSTRTWSLHIPCYQRGQFTAGPVVLASHGPLGLFQQELSLGGRSSILVYPKTVDLAPFLVEAARTTGGESPWLSLAGVTPPVRGVRDYRLGDSYSRIHWPSSARLRRLMSKELEQEGSQDVWLLLDMEARHQAGKGTESTAEYGVLLAASLGKALVEANRSVGLATWGSHLQIEPPGKGSAQVWRILEALSLTTAQGTEPLSRLMSQVEWYFRGGGTLVIITASAEESWLSGLDSALRWGCRVLVFWVDASSFEPGRPRPRPTLVSDQVASYQVRKGELWRLGPLPG